jgi:hypothetical protein
MSLWKAIPVLTRLRMAGYDIDVQGHRPQNREVYRVGQMAIQLLEVLKNIPFVVSDGVGVQRHVELFQR